MLRRVSHARCPRVLDSTGSPGLVAAAVPKDSPGKHDYVLVCDGEIRIPASFGQKRARKRLSEFVGDHVVGLEFEEGANRWLRVTDKVRDILPLDPRQTQAGHLHLRARAQALSQQGSADHRANLYEQPDLAPTPNSTCGGLPICR